jgi:hypothetical protein
VVFDGRPQKWVAMIQGYPRSSKSRKSCFKFRIRLS